jgi:hypothetical protein
MIFTASSGAGFKPSKRSSTAAWVLAIERDHLSPGLAATDHLERPDFDAFCDGVGNGGGRFARKARFEPGAV